MFLVLGAVTVVGPDGQVVALSDRQRSLLASLLARADAVVSVDNLVDLAWPEDPPQDPVAALHNQVSRLRRTIPFTRIETVAPGYRLAVDPDDVDSQRFDRLVRADTARSLSEALSLWHGAAYAEFAESPVARFEAIRLEEARRQAIERWHELRLDEGSPDLPALEAFATEHPLRERAHLVRMRALYACGRQPTRSRRTNATPTSSPTSSGSSLRLPCRNCICAYSATTLRRRPRCERCA